MTDGTERTVVLTGATSGIGRRAALRLADRGATVAAIGRDESKGRTLVDAAGEAAGDVAFYRADLASQTDVRDLAADLRERHGAIDVLAHNAGLSRPERAESPDGTELTLAVNHLAPYLLTRELVEELRAGAPSRVVVTASSLHRGADLDLDDLQLEGGYDAMAAYARSKLANVAFALELAERLDERVGDERTGDDERPHEGERAGDAGRPHDEERAGGDGQNDRGTDAAEEPRVVANCFHPGFVPGTRLFRHLPLHQRLAIRLLAAAPLVGSSVEAAAGRLVEVATAPEFGERTGCYVVDGEPAEPDATARDPDVRDRLWEHSAELVGVDPEWP